jgi:tRNA(adenine34) deaminase
VVFGARDPKTGAVESLYQVLTDSRLNHQPKVVGGILENDCSKILKDFFASRRKAGIN